MSWSTVEAFQQEMEATISECQRFMYITRAVEDQRATVETLRVLLEKLRTEKQVAIANRAEEWANLLLLNESITSMFYEFGRMWVFIKEDEMNQAWDSLVSAQIAIRDAILVRSEPALESLNERLHIIEKTLFPPLIFNSPGFVAEASECSICRSEYGECEHVKGRVYMGQICSRIYTKFTIVEFSMVDDPANKHCRVLSFHKDGVTRDWMTWKVIDPPPESPSEPCA